jgi:hypothetical protein
MASAGHLVWAEARRLVGATRMRRSWRLTIEPRGEPLRRLRRQCFAFVVCENFLLLLHRCRREIIGMGIMCQILNMRQRSNDTKLHEIAGSRLGVLVVPVRLSSVDPDVLRNRVYFLFQAQWTRERFVQWQGVPRNVR